jgi:hypothetical protein
MPLFRPEALRGQDTLHGEVSLVPPVTWPVLVGVVLVAAAVGYLFLGAVVHGAPILARGVQGAGEVRLTVPASAAELLQEGQSLKLAVDAYPYEANGAVTGRVTSISAGTARVVLEPSMAEAHLAAAVRPGMTLTARIPGPPQTLLARIAGR